MGYRLGRRHQTPCLRHPRRSWHAERSFGVRAACCRFCPSQQAGWDFRSWQGNEVAIGVVLVMAIRASELAGGKRQQAARTPKLRSVDWRGPKQRVLVCAGSHGSIASPVFGLHLSRRAHQADHRLGRIHMSRWMRHPRWPGLCQLQYSLPSRGNRRRALIAVEARHGLR